MSKEKTSKCSRKTLTHEAKDCFEQYFGTQMAPISRDVTWRHCVCQNHCATCRWNRYEDSSSRRVYLNNGTMHMKLEHAINTWKGRIQRELLDLSAKRAGKPLIYRSSNPTFMQKCKEKRISNRERRLAQSQADSP